VIVAGRQKSIAFFIALGAGLICVIILLYVGWHQMLVESGRQITYFVVKIDAR
jgi:hypothetical protein